jgi:hypothetical protein
MKHLPILRKLSLTCTLGLALLSPLGSAAQEQVYPVWDVRAYPDEAGFQLRVKGMLPRIASKGFGERSKSLAHCPDTGLPVYSWALEGEDVISPYTGRKFKQGPTGYFGAKQRDSLGRIFAFGGDPLKYDLPPTMATLMLEPSQPKARYYLSIPGNWRQQYHFAAKNWVRFYALIGHKWDSIWQQGFRQAIAGYAESRRPSDGPREHNPMSRPHNLVGERGQLLGGNMKDGGTENHKTMWRTSALVYAQWFPPDALISGVPAPEAARLTDSMLNDYVKRLAYTGNGEYDSQMYYPHSIGAFLNVFDFSKDKQYRELAQAAVDYYLATYGLKVYDGAIAGAQKRGFLPGEKPGEMEMYLWTWGAGLSRNIPKEDQLTSLHQITSGYRPNRVIMNIINKKLPLPFEAFMNRPSYHMNERSRFQETFYASHSFGMGSVAMSMVDNPAQQTIWSLVAKGTNGPIAFGAMQPRYLNPTGHSPYTQTLQKKGALIVATAQTRTSGANTTVSQQARQEHAAYHLVELPSPDPAFSRQQWYEWMEQSRKSASTWLFIPRNGTLVEERKEGIVVQANQTLVFIRTLGERQYWISPPDTMLASLPDKDPLRIFNQYRVLATAGNYSGFIVQAAEVKQYPSIDAFIQQNILKTRLDVSQWPGKGKIQYKSLQGDDLEMQYNHSDLRCSGRINGRTLDYGNWADGAVYKSPYVQIKDGVMRFTDGEDAYRIDCRGDRLKFLE